MIEDMQSLTMPDGSTVEYADRGSGEPVLLIHGGVFADWFAPLMTQPALDDSRLIRIRRAGYATGPAAPAGLGIVDHAAHAALLADELGIRDVVVVGHSSGALIALELAVTRPDVVGRLLLVEPAPGGRLVTPEGVAARSGLEQMVMSAGSDAAVYDTFMSIVCAADHRDVVTAALGAGAVDRSIAESHYFFSDEMPAVGQWQFDEHRASEIEQPTTLVVGGASPPPVHDVADRLRSWLTDVEPVTVDGADHLLPLRRPHVMADLVADSVAARASTRSNATTQ